MFGRMQILLNRLETLRHNFSTTQINLNFLDSMPKIWKPKKTTITKACNLKKLKRKSKFKVSLMA